MYSECLTLDGAIAFGGKVRGGLTRLPPDGRHVVYPLGSSLVLKHLETQALILFPAGGEISCVSVSADGKYAAAGELAAAGNKACVTLWDLEHAIAAGSSHESLHHKLSLHRGSVQSIAFSPCGSLLASVGGPEDNILTVTDVASGKPLASAPASSHATHVLSWLHNCSDKLITGGQFHLRTWTFNLERRRLTPEDVKITNAKRIFSALALDTDGKHAFCGTTSGDVMQVDVVTGRLVAVSKVRFSQGITACQLWGGRLLVGTGDGAFARLNVATLDSDGVIELQGAVTSICLPLADATSPGRLGATAAAATSLTLRSTGSSSRKPAATTTLQQQQQQQRRSSGGAASEQLDPPRALVGTAGGGIYSVDCVNMKAALVSTAHSAPVLDVVFPSGCSDLVVTAAGSEIRLWNVPKKTELLRIQVPNVTVTCVVVAADGSAIVSGWSDGRVRAFLPESGKLMWVIHDAHSEGVSALALSRSGARLVSGGTDGRVRVWGITPHNQVMEQSWKEHKKTVTSVSINANGDEAITASADGSCLIWNLRKGTRSNALFASTEFRAAVMHPDESQILTVGSDRRITYWDSSDCTSLRVIEGSTEEITTAAIDGSGDRFVTSGLDKMVRVWGYDMGEPIAIGQAHSTAVNKLAISPDRQTIVSVGADGAIFIWRMPSEQSPWLAQ